MEDAGIVELYFTRDENAIAESDRKFGAYCHTVAYNILNDREDAKECVNDTWRRAWYAIPPARPRKLSTFFGRIARNLALDRYAERNAQKRGGGNVALALDELEYCVGTDDTPEKAMTDAELAESLDRFLRALPARERNVFICRYYDLKSQREVAKKYGMTESAVKSSLFRCRQKLKARLEGEGIII